MHKSLVCFSLLMQLFISGCALHWQSSWQEAGVDRSTYRTGTLFKQANDCLGTASDGASVDRCISLYEAVLLDNPGHYSARVQAANLYILKGTAYSSSDDKSLAFLRAMKYSELAMYSNPGFKQRVDAGIHPWEATDALGEREAEAMLFWVTALQYEFKEGMSLPSKIVNIKWLQRSMIFLDRIETVAPAFGGGAVEFAKAINYMVIPESFGGSETRADEYMTRAATKGRDWLFPKWAMGKYYLPVKGEYKAASDQLAWVAAQNPVAYPDSYPWIIHFQDDARQIISRDGR